MNYEPTIWKDGDLVTSAKLNKIEQGISNGGSIPVIHVIDDILDKTWQEIYDAGCGIIIMIDSENGNISCMFIQAIWEESDSQYCISGFNHTVGPMNFYADSPDSYPEVIYNEVM